MRTIKRKTTKRTSGPKISKSSTSAKPESTTHSTTSRRQPPKPPKRKREPCIVKGCKKDSVYASRINNPDGKMEFYCAKDWKKRIESSPAFMNAVKTWEDTLFPRSRKSTAKTKTRRKVVRRSAGESASVSVRRVVRRKK